MLQHATSRPSTLSTQQTMVNPPKMNLSLLPASTYGKWMKRSTRRRYQANDRESGMEADSVRAHGALCSLQSKKRLVARKRCGLHIVSNKGKEKWIEDYVDRETAEASKRVQHPERVHHQNEF